MDFASVPELPAGLLCLEGPPVRLHEQRGRVVALAFVNAASAWCAQRLAELERLRSRHAGRLRLVVVNVPRFDRERDPQYALQQLRRQGLTSPVLHDADWRAWRAFGIEAWPTVCLIDGEGRMQGRVTGLGAAGELERALAALCEPLPVPEAEAGAGREARAPVQPQRPLCFPAGLAATANRLYVADSGHHRVLECDHGGRVLRRFGLGTGGFVDGPAEQAAFLRPQGLALAHATLYVADTGNHAVRRIHLHSGEVDTLLGSGRPGGPREGTVSAPREVALDRPQALALADNRLYLATAGDNRIWRYELGGNALHLQAGTGALELHDGPAAMAAFAQPVALAAVQQVLYVCDALGSAIRSVQLRGDRVQTLVGQGRWEFGDRDGPRDQARLQHPQAIALSPDAPQLWVADSGNGRLRLLRLGGGELSTPALPRPLQGPAGLAVAGGAVWIAETGAHALLRYDPASGTLAEVAVQA